MLCIHCGRFSDTLLCPACSNELKDQAYRQRYSALCPTCNRPLQDTAYPCPFCQKGLQAYASYTGIVSSLLNQFKAGEEKAIAKILAPLYIPMLETLKKPLLLPVPASRKGLSDRGFDQMRCIVARLGRMTGYPSLLLFAQKGEGQSKFLSLEQRKMRHTLSLIPKDKEVGHYKKGGYTFVLLDDICTTGSTLETCKALLAARYGIEASSVVVAMV